MYQKQFFQLILILLILQFSNSSIFAKTVIDCEYLAAVAEENKEEVDLGEKLEKLVEEIKEVMERRKERIAELRAEIERIEQDNVSLETTIGELLKGF